MGRFYVSTIANIGGRDGDKKYGFIKSDYSSGVFFHFSAISKASKLAGLVLSNPKNLINEWVCFSIDPYNGRDGRDCANIVFLLKELAPDFPDEATFCAAVDSAISRERKPERQLITELVAKADDALLAEHPNWLEYVDEQRYLRFFESQDDETMIKYMCLHSSDGIHKHMMRQLIAGLNEERLERLLASANPQFSEIVFRYAEEPLVLRHPDWWANAPIEWIPKLLPAIDFTNTDPEYLVNCGALLGNFEADANADLSVRIVKRMYDQGAAFSMPWWKYLTDSVKVRMIIYCSNLREDLKKWQDRLARISDFEKEKEAREKAAFEREQADFNRISRNLIVLTMLKFLGILYLKDPAKKQARFMEAHNMLMEYIIGCFNQRDDVTPALSVLMEHCVNNPDQKSFCDGKYWEQSRGWKKLGRSTIFSDGEVVVFCPRKTNQEHGGRACPFLDSQFRRKLPSEDEIAYEAGKDHEQKPAENRFAQQHLTDFLRNLDFVPDISMIIEQETDSEPRKSREPWAYGFLISGYVNRLMDMRPHMRCKCGSFITCNFKYESRSVNLSATRFSCPKLQEPGADPAEHDKDIYLNHCRRCGYVIDSRECKHQDEYGYWLCMTCGGSEKYKAGERCPNCGHVFTKAERLEHRMLYGGRIIRCFKCGHDGGSDEWSIVKKLNPDQA